MLVHVCRFCCCCCFMLVNSDTFWCMLMLLLLHAGTCLYILVHSGTLWYCCCFMLVYSDAIHSGTLWCMLEHSGTFWCCCFMLVHSDAMQMAAPMPIMFTRLCSWLQFSLHSPALYSFCCVFYTMLVFLKVLSSANCQALYTCQVLSTVSCQVLFTASFNVSSCANCQVLSSARPNEGREGCLFYSPLFLYWAPLLHCYTVTQCTVCAISSPVNAS